MNTITLHTPAKSINATIQIPGSKSYTNRALILAALARGESSLIHASLSADSYALIAALTALGFHIEGSEHLITVEGRGGERSSAKEEIDVGPAGTTMRFLTAFCAATTSIDRPDTIALRGTERMHLRPIEPLTTALRALGATINFLGRDGCPPLSISSHNKLRGGHLQIDGSVSSQFISALLMVAPLYAETLTLEVTGPSISQSYIDMTIQSMRDFGVDVVFDGTISDSSRMFIVPAGQQYKCRTYPIEGDASGASYLWGLAAVTSGTITTTNVNPTSAQGDIKFSDLLQAMGCSVTTTQDSITVTGPSHLKAIDVDMKNMPDTAQTLAVVAACAEGATVIRGLSTLRVKETDRIAALHDELLKMGITTEQGSDYLVVHGGQPKAARIATYEDHRMAMSFAVLAGVVDGIEIEEPEVVAKSFPTFWDVMQVCGIRVSSEKAEKNAD